MHKTINALCTALIVLFIGGKLFAEVSFDFNGDLQYRLRYHYLKLKDSEGKDSSAAPDFSNRYAWNLKCKATVNDNLLIGIRLSNPNGYATDNVADNTEWVTKGNVNLLTIPELYFKWSVDFFSLSAGIIPVMPNAVLNLVAYEHKNYLGAGISPWSVWMNNSQKGLEFAFRFVNTDQSAFGINILATLAEDALGTDTADAFIHDKIRFMISFPTAFLNRKISVLPVVHVKLNNFRTLDTALDEVSHTVAGGIDVNAKFTERTSLQFGAAGGAFENKCQSGDYVRNEAGDLVPVTMIAPMGMLFHLGLVNKDNVGKAMIDFKFGRARDREARQIINKNLLHWDIKYALPIKSLAFIPRLRIWYFTNDITKIAETRVRPELILKASF